MKKSSKKIIMVISLMSNLYPPILYYNIGLIILFLVSAMQTIKKMLTNFFSITFLWMLLALNSLISFLIRLQSHIQPVTDIYSPSVPLQPTQLRYTLRKYTGNAMCRMYLNTYTLNVHTHFTHTRHLSNQLLWYFQRQTVQGHPLSKFQDWFGLRIH